MPTEDEWESARIEAAAELALFSKKSKRRWVTEESRDKRIAEPVQRGWLDLDMDDTATYEDYDNRSSTYHDWCVNYAKPAEKETYEQQAPRFYNREPEEIYLVQKTYSETDYESYDVSGLVKFLGSFDDLAKAEEFAQLRRAYYIGVDDEISIVKTSVTY